MLSTNMNLTPRQSRVIRALLQTLGWLWREEIDQIAVCSNGPEIIRQLRKRFGDDAIEMEQVDTVDSDGLPSRPGRYRLSPVGRYRLFLAGVK